MIFTKNTGASHIETAFPLLLSREADLIKKCNDKKKVLFKASYPLKQARNQERVI